MASPGDMEDMRFRMRPGPGFGTTYGDAAEDTPTRPPPRKRRRIVISCTECHRRKQKVCVTEMPAGYPYTFLCADAHCSRLTAVRSQAPLQKLSIAKQARCL